VTLESIRSFLAEHQISTWALLTFALICFLSALLAAREFITWYLKIQNLERILKEVTSQMSTLQEHVSHLQKHLDTFSKVSAKENINTKNSFDKGNLAYEPAPQNNQAPITTEAFISLEQSEISPINIDKKSTLKSLRSKSSTPAFPFSH
jgi:hypothetical protein